MQRQVAVSAFAGNHSIRLGTEDKLSLSCNISICAVELCQKFWAYSPNRDSLFIVFILLVASERAGNNDYIPPWQCHLRRFRWSETLSVIRRLYELVKFQNLKKRGKASGHDTSISWQRTGKVTLVPDLSRLKYVSLWRCIAGPHFATDWNFIRGCSFFSCPSLETWSRPTGCVLLSMGHGRSSHVSVLLLM